MKTVLAIAATLALAGCANTGSGLNGTPRAMAAKGNTYYCWKERLTTEGNNLVCNWEANATDACRSTELMSIARATVSKGPENTRRCENGEWLVVVTTK